MFEAFSGVEVRCELAISVNDFVFDILKNDVPQVVGDLSDYDTVIFDMGEAEKFNPVRVATLMQRVQNVIDYWYDGHDFVLTCTKCNRFTDLEDWSEASGKRIQEEYLDSNANEELVCPHCRKEVLLADILYEDSGPTKDPWIVDDAEVDEVTEVACTTCGDYASLEEWGEANGVDLIDNPIKDFRDHSMVCPTCASNVEFGECLDCQVSEWKTGAAAPEKWYDTTETVDDDGDDMIELSDPQARNGWGSWSEWDEEDDG